MEKITVKEEDMMKIWNVIEEAIKKCYMYDIKEGIIKVDEDEIEPFEEWEFDESYFDQIYSAREEILKIFNAKRGIDIESDIKIL